MTRAQRRREPNQPTPVRWGRLVAGCGLVLALVGGWLQYDRHRAATATAVPVAEVATDSGARPATPTAREDRKRVVPSKPPVVRQTVKPGSTAIYRISLPGLDVSAPVVAIRARRGSLVPPSDPEVVGWWADGARPGAKTGSAVITGHTVHNGGGAFDDIDRVREGDPIIVLTARGPLRYSVTSVATYRKQTLARHAAKVFDQRVPGRLVLVTCEDWNGRVYLSNAVVFAERIR